MIETLNGTPYAEVPSWFTNRETTGLISFEDRDGDGVIRYSGDPTANELRVDRDIMVLANPEIANLPPWVVALVVAGALAAALSTAAGLLLVISSSVSHDLIKSMYNPDLSERHELLLARLAAGAAVIMAGLLGIYPLGFYPLGFVAQVVALAFGLAVSSFFPVLVPGVFSKRVNKEGAIAGMLSGIAFTATCILYYKSIASDSGPEDWGLGISPEGIGTLRMLLNFAVTLVVSRLTPEPPREVAAMVEEMRLARALNDQSS